MHETMLNSTTGSIYKKKLLSFTRANCDVCSLAFGNNFTNRVTHDPSLIHSLHSIHCIMKFTIYRHKTHWERHKVLFLLHFRAFS